MVEAMVGLERFLDFYVEEALHETDNSTPSGGVPFNRNYTRENIAPETIAQMRADCLSFMTQAGDVIDLDLEDAASDFWNTRNGTGVGFWDGDWDHLGGEAVTKLTDLAHGFGTFDLYLGDDGMIYGM